MAAIGTMDMVGGMARADVAGGAGGWIGGAYFDAVLVGVVTMGGMEVAIVQVVHMIAVLNSHVAAAGPVNVGMILMDLAGH